MEQTLSRGNVKVLSDVNFDQRGIPKLNTSKPIVVALLSESCGWCHKTVPEIIKAANNNSFVMAAVIVGKSSIGNQMLQASKSSGVPTFLLFKQGKFKNKSSGAKNESGIIQFSRS